MSQLVCNEVARYNLFGMLETKGCGDMAQKYYSELLCGHGPHACMLHDSGFGREGCWSAPSSYLLCCQVCNICRQRMVKRNAERINIYRGLLTQDASEVAEDVQAFVGDCVHHSKTLVSANGQPEKTT